MKARALICFVLGHKRHPDPPGYWHSLERCARCDVLTVSPSVTPERWQA